jgi:hypothetical protein
MTRHSALLFIFVFLANLASAQMGSVTGVVKDAQTGETLIGANILIEEGRGTDTDFEGKFRVLFPAGLLCGL